MPEGTAKAKATVPAAVVVGEAGCVVTVVLPNFTLEIALLGANPDPEITTRVPGAPEAGDGEATETVAVVVRVQTKVAAFPMVSAMLNVEPLVLLLTGSSTVPL